MLYLGLALCAGLACWLQMETPGARWLQGFGGTAATLILLFSVAGPLPGASLWIAALGTFADTMVLLFLSACVGVWLRDKTPPRMTALLWGGTCLGLLWLAAP